MWLKSQDKGVATTKNDNKVATRSVRSNPVLCQPTEVQLLSETQELR